MHTLPSKPRGSEVSFYLPHDCDSRDTLASSCPHPQSALVTSLRSDVGCSPRAAPVLLAASSSYSQRTRDYCVEEFTCWLQVSPYHRLWLGVTLLQALLLAFAVIT